MLHRRSLLWSSEDHRIEEADVIEKILTHLDAKAAEREAQRRPP